MNDCKRFNDIHPDTQDFIVNSFSAQLSMTKDYTRRALQMANPEFIREEKSIKMHPDSIAVFQTVLAISPAVSKKTSQKSQNLYIQVESTAFLEMVKKMREAQTRYYAHRTGLDLKRAKELGSQVDQYLKDNTPPPTAPSNLFS